MKYYVVASYMGTMDEIPSHDTLESAIATMNEWNAEEEAAGHEPGFWKVVDENGNDVDTEGR